MNTIISNKIRINNPTIELERWILNNLTVTNPKWETLVKLGKQAEITRYHIKKDMALYVKIGNDYIVPFGTLSAIWGYIKSFPYEIKFNDAGRIHCSDAVITQPLYDYQEEAVQKMLAAKGGILVSGCGSGKTNIAVEICHRIGRKFLWLTHTKDLVNQSYARFKMLYPDIDIGITGDGKINFGKDGTIATVQTMEKIDPDIYKNEFDVVITDECHRISGSPTLRKMFVKVIENIPARYKYGVTASDSRNDSLTKTMYATVGCDMNGQFGPVWRIDRNEINTLTAEHIKFELNTPFSYEMLADDGTFNYVGLVDYISNNEERNKTIVDNILKIAKEGHKQLVLCARIEQCELLNKMLEDAGCNSQLLVGKVSSKKREQILTQQVEWDVIVATVSLAKEGLDVKELDTLHLVSCLGNKSDTVQAVGRIERVCDGKKDPKVYDYVDTKIPYLVSKYKKRVSWLKKRY